MHLILHVLLGASLIEKHFKMPGDKSSVDASFSMDLSELPELKSSLKSIYSAIGTPTLELPKSAKYHTLEEDHCML